MRSPHLIETIKERCRVCYTCVRECPAKAIRIAEGQAEILAERCIACGNCVRVCSQRAKLVLDSIETVKALLAGAEPVAAIVAPSFPAEFAEYPWRTLVGMIRALGFAGVHEVAFGADLVAVRYRRLLHSGDGRRYIATSCPAVVAFVEKHFPELVGSLAPIVSPMIAAARALRRVCGQGLRVVFIGPCIAKKGEVDDGNLAQEVDAALTFPELRAMFQGADLGGAAPGDFDPPCAGPGALFPISRGLFQAAEIDDDLVEGAAVVADGRIDFVEAIREFSDGHLKARLLEVLACKGCITGPGMTGDVPLYTRRRRVSEFVKERLARFDKKRWVDDLKRLEDLDLGRKYTPRDVRIAVPFEEEIRQILARMGKRTAVDELNCGACGYDTCREHATAIFKGLAETEMCLPYTIEQLHTTVDELGKSNRQLADMQEALMQSEKLASMGQLAAGIAHEVNNPLGIVLMYAHLLLEERGGDAKIREDLEMITQHADRCKKIVAGLLNFARQTKVLRQETDVCRLVERTIRTLPAPEEVEVRIEHAIADPMAEIDGDQIAQVLTNLVSNAYAAMGDGGTLTIRSEGDESFVRLKVTDTGCGIPAENRKKIFEPFFTTKQMGKGTGLGLAVTYGIIKMHSGDIRVESNADPKAGPTGTMFTVTLPRRGAREEAASAK